MNKISELLLRLPVFGGKKVRMEQAALIALRVLCILLALALAAGAVWVTRKQTVETESSVYTVTTSSTAKYEVRLKENNFFEKDRLDMGENYIRAGNNPHKSR